MFRFPHIAYRDQESQNHYRREAGDEWLDNHSGTRRESAAGNRLHRYMNKRSITELDFYQITSDSVITNERMVAITLIMEVKCPAFLFAVCCEERGIQIQDHCLRNMDAVEPFLSTRLISWNCFKLSSSMRLKNLDTVG